ncbi:MAG: hypothetical protein JXQ82_07325 [Methanomicrobiaceae archaeon]|nr:hypothetical protein [Methanomicrobiaceae archaeon]
MKRTKPKKEKIPEKAGNFFNTNLKDGGDAEVLKTKASFKENYAIDSTDQIR